MVLISKVGVATLRQGWDPASVEELKYIRDWGEGEIDRWIEVSSAVMQTLVCCSEERAEHWNIAVHSTHVLWNTFYVVAYLSNYDMLYKI